MVFFRNGLGQGKPQLLLADHASLDRRAETLPQQTQRTLRTRASAALAPAVTSTVSSPREPAQVDVGRPVDQMGRHAAGRAISASRRLLELFWLPTTSTTSASAARTRTASCRFWVA